MASRIFGIDRRRLRLILAAGAGLAAMMLVLVSLGPVDRPVEAITGPSLTPTPTRSAGSEATAMLRRYIPAAVRATCADYVPPAKDPLGRRLVAAVRCEPRGRRAPAMVWYFRYADVRTARTAYGAYVKGEFKPGDCTGSRQRMSVTTRHPTTRGGGVLHCYEADGDKTFAWIHDDLRIVAFASDSTLSYRALKKWWKRAGPDRRP